MTKLTSGASAADSPTTTVVETEVEVHLLPISQAELKTLEGALHTLSVMVELGLVIGGESGRLEAQGRTLRQVLNRVSFYGVRGRQIRAKIDVPVDAPAPVAE